MRRRHFEQLQPLCPVCRTQGTQSPLRLHQVLREDADHIVEGILHCSSSACQREFPIVDGIPLILADLRQYISDNIQALTARRDLSELTESMLGDCCGPGSPLDSSRQHLSSYTWDHYAEFDPAEPTPEPRPGSLIRVLDAGLELAGEFPSGPVLDAGCSVGRSTFALAQRTSDLVLGVDLNFPMLRLAGEVLRTGTVRYPRRRVGVVYDRREFPVHFEHAERVDFWACDAAALPLADSTFAAASCLNLLDCLSAPALFLAELGRVLKQGSRAIIACPYDWSAAVTPLENWLGGHSQRSEIAGASEPILRLLLTPGGHTPASNLRLLAEADNLPWQVRLHARSIMQYQVHLVVVEAVKP